MPWLYYNTKGVIDNSEWKQKQTLIFDNLKHICFVRIIKNLTEYIGQ